MKRTILKLLAMAFCFATAEALRCYSCKLGLGDLCYTTEKTCPSGQHCFSGVGTAAGLLDIKMKGCLEEAKCNKTTSVNFPESSNSTIYSVTKTCCNTDLCNGAPSSLPGVLQLTLASVMAVLAANALV